MGREENPHALLVRIQIGAVTVENGMQVHQKIQNITTTWSSNFGYLFEDNENTSKKRYLHPTSIAALFTIAKIWKQPKRPLTDEWIKKIVYTYIYMNIIQP